MPTPPQILWGFLIPALIAGALAIIGGRIPRRSTWGAVIGFAAGFVLAYHTFKGNWPSLKPTDADNRTALITLAAAALAVVVGFRHIPNLFYRLLALLAPVGLTIWIILGLPVSSQPRPVWEWIGGISLVVILITILSEGLARRRGAAAATLTLGPLAAGIGLVLMLSGSATEGNIAAAVALMVLGWFLAGLTDRQLNLARGPVLVAIVPLAGLLLYPALPPSPITPLEIALLCIAAPLAWIAEIPPMARWRPWKRELLRLALVAIPIIIAVTLAVIQFKKDSMNQLD